MQTITEQIRPSPPNDFKGNFGCKIGLIGFGVIGRKVAELMKPFRVNILADDPVCIR